MESNDSVVFQSEVKHTGNRFDEFATKIAGILL